MDKAEIIKAIPFGHPMTPFPQFPTGEELIQYIQRMNTMKQKSREYKRKYTNKPENKAKRKEIRDRPEVKARKREYDKEYRRTRDG